MWSRVELKSNAKEVLRRTYWLSFAVSVAAALLGEVGMMPYMMNLQQSTWQLVVPAGILLSISVIGFLYSLLIGGVLTVGVADFYMTSRQYDVSFTKIFSGFSRNYWNVVKTMFLQSLYISLWSLLLIIPGIVKSFEYFFIPYLMAENPFISTARAFEISREMTRGKKMDIFLLQLSFFGWLFLGMLACGFGVAFVTPYIEATSAELYAACRAEALQRGVVTEEEMCGFYEDKQ